MSWNSYQKVGFGRHGAIHGCGKCAPTCTRQTDLHFTPDEVNSLLSHVKSVQYLTKQILERKAELEAITGFQEQLVALQESVENLSRGIVDGVERTENKVTVIRPYVEGSDGTNPTEASDDKYPTEKAVAEALSNIFEQLEEIDKIGNLDTFFGETDWEGFTLAQITASLRDWVKGVSRSVGNLSDALGYRNDELTKVAVLDENGKVPESMLPDGFGWDDEDDFWE